MYLYTDRILIQILAFSLGPLIGLLAAAFINPWSGPFIGLVAFIGIFLQPRFSDLCLKNTAQALGLGKIILGEGKVNYQSRSMELSGKLFLDRENLFFVIDNKIDFSLPVEKIIKVKGEIEEYNREALLELTPVFERKSPNLPQVTAMVANLASVSNGLLQVTIKQDTFQNQFSFTVTNPSLWVKKIDEILKSRAQ